MSFRNAVILSFCIAAGLEVFSGCAYNDKYVEIVLVDSGRQPESVPSQNQNHIPADTGNEANSVYAPEEVTYDGVGKAEEKQEQRPKKSAKPTALPDVTPTPLPTATPTPTFTPLPTPLPTPKPCRNVDASTYKHAGAHAGRTGRKVQRRAGCRKRRAR